MQRRFQRIIRRIHHAAVFHEQRVIPFAVHVALPAVGVGALGEGEGFRRLQFESQPLFQLDGEILLPHALERVFQTRQLAVGAVAEIALDGDDLPAGIERFLLRDKADDGAKQRVGLRISVRHAHAAAHRHVEAGERAVFFHGNQADIMREYVRVVIGRHGDGDLEFARQVMGEVKWVFLHRVRRQLFFVQPDFMEGAGFWQQMLADGAGEFKHFRMEGRGDGVRPCHHVAVYIAAGGDGVEADVIKGLQRRLDDRFDDAVNLHCLARGDLDGSGAEMVADARDAKPLLRRDLARRDA